MSSRRIQHPVLPLWSRLWVVTWTATILVHASGNNLVFFERRIRPLFAEHCFECHGVKKQEAGLRLDTSEGLAKGGESGPAWVAYDPDASRIIQTVRRPVSGSEIPPKHRLSLDKIELLEAWVQRGAPIPPVTTGKMDALPPLHRTNHWAYELIRTSPIPRVGDPKWPRTSADNFILARLEAKG